METRAIDYSVKFDNVNDLEAFSQHIKNAMVDRLALTEKFSALRLSKIRLSYNDWLHKKQGFATADGRIEVTQHTTAINLAGTVIHELAHQLAGVDEYHSRHWQDACHLLGLTNHASLDSKPEDFDSYALQVISDAILKFAKENPGLLVDDTEVEIPWPAHVGRYDCPNEHESFHECYVDGVVHHKCHILKFQIDGIHEMLRKIKSGKNILLADEMGLGKTVEVMGLLNVIKPDRVFVGCPNNVKYVWRNHFRDYSTLPFANDVEVAHTTLYMFGSQVIMNYEAIRKWYDAVNKQPWDVVIFDEGHYLKTPSAARTKASLSIKGKLNIIATGTPIVNYPYEVFPLIHHLDRANWPEYGRFEAEHGSRTSEKLGRNLNRLNAKLRSTIMVRRLKKDVLAELPKKRRQIVEFEVNDNIRKLIESEKALFNQLQGNNDIEMAKFLNAMKNEGEVVVDDLDWAAIIEAMKQTKRFAFEEMAKIAHEIARAKLPFAIEHIEGILEAREKVVVFGHHRDVLTKVADHFRGQSVLLLGGNQDQAAVTAMAAEQFNEKEECRVFCAGVQLAAGYSLKGSSTVIFIEEDWVPGVMTQAEDRAHGIGRGDADAKSMLIQHLVFEDSLDTYKAQLTIKKQKSIDRAMNRF